MEYNNLQLILKDFTTYTELAELLSPSTAKRLLYEKGWTPRLSVVRQMSEAGIRVPSGYPMTVEELIERISNFDEKDIERVSKGRVRVRTLYNMKRGQVEDPRWFTVVSICDAIDALASVYN